MAVMNMGGVPVVITPIVDAKGPMKVVGTLADRLGEQRLMWFMDRVVSPFMGEIFEKRFDQHGDETVGGPWRPLTSYTERLKRSLGFPADAPNVRTGDLKHHLMHDHAVGAFPGGVYLRIPGDSSPLQEKKMRTAQFGEDAGANKFGRSTPPRKILGLGAVEEVGINKLFDSYLWFGL